MAKRDEFKDIRDILAEVEKIEKITEVVKSTRKQLGKMSRSTISYYAPSIKGQLTKALKETSSKTRQAKIKRTLELAKKKTQRFEGKTYRQIADEARVDMTIEEMAEFSMRYGYHTATDYAYETQDLYKLTMIKNLKGLYPRERAEEMIRLYNQKVEGSSLDKFGEVEIIDILSKI